MSCKCDQLESGWICTECRTGKSLSNSAQTACSVTLGDKNATQKFVIFNTLVSHCWEKLTPDNVEAITDEINKAMREGSCSWAFK